MDEFTREGTLTNNIKVIDDNMQFIVMPAIKSLMHSVDCVQANFDLCSCRPCGRHFIKQYPLAGFYNIQPGYETQLY